MNDLWQALALAGALGSGLIGGVFFAFSSFVMPALTRLPAKQGVAAMQSINLTVLRPSFLGVFFGTALLSLATFVLAVLHHGEPGAAFFMIAAACYLVGTFLVTALCNVPLNEQLVPLDPEAPDASDSWQRYTSRWTPWNHLRTTAALLATLAFCLGLTQL